MPVKLGSRFDFLAFRSYQTMTKIYKITNLINSKSYVGKTNGCIFVRLKQHISESAKVRSINRPLYRAFNKYGVSNFSIELIEEVAEEEATAREIYWVREFDTYKTGYNATIGGDTGSFINKELVVKTYTELGSGAAVARKLGCSISSVYNILSYCNVANKGAGFSQRIGVVGLKDNKELEFDSMLAAATYIKSVLSNKTTAIKMTQHISLCCRGIRKSAYGYKWKYKVRR